MSAAAPSAAHTSPIPFVSSSLTATTLVNKQARRAIQLADSARSLIDTAGEQRPGAWASERT